MSFWKIHSQKHERRDTHEPNECKFNEQLNCELTSKEKLRSCCMCSATQCFQRMFSMIMSVVIKWNICDFCDNCRDWDNKRFTVRNYLISICLRIYHNYIKVRKFWQKIKSLEGGSNPKFFILRKKILTIKIISIRKLEKKPINLNPASIYSINNFNGGSDIYYVRVFINWKLKEKYWKEVVHATSSPQLFIFYVISLTHFIHAHWTIGWWR